MCVSRVITFSWMARAFFTRARSFEEVCSIVNEPVAAAIIARTSPGRRNTPRRIVGDLVCERYAAISSSDAPLRENLCRHSDRVNERHDLTTAKAPAPKLLQVTLLGVMIASRLVSIEHV